MSNKTVEKVLVEIKQDMFSNTSFILRKADNISTILSIHKAEDYKDKLYNCTFECTATTSVSTKRLLFQNSTMLILPTIYVGEAFVNNYWNENAYYIDNKFNICKYFTLGHSSYLVYFRDVPSQTLSIGCYSRGHSELCYYDLSELNCIELAEIKSIAPEDKQELKDLFSKVDNII